MIHRPLDGVRWRVAGDGDYRTRIARFAFHYEGKRVLRGLNTTRYAIDRDDGPDWMVETFDTAVPIDDGGRRRTVGRDDPAREIARLASWTGLFKRYGSNERRNR